MSDKIISFPLRSNLPITPELVEEWKAGLASKDVHEQWQTYERMSNFSDIHVIQLVQEFLSAETGDDWLKTKLLQTLKRTCPASLNFHISKRNQSTQLTLNDVPLELTDWPETELKPLAIMEEKAYADPTLLKMATELWTYFLEKNYPFYPDLAAEHEWSAGLHMYTLALIDEELANRKLQIELPKLYRFTSEQLVQYYQRLITFL